MRDTDDVRPSHRFHEHTGELQLELVAPTPAGLFEEAATALAGLIRRRPGETARRTLDLAAEDLALLLVDWLDELVFLAETEGFVPDRVTSLELADTSLRAEVEGRSGEPAHLVKAVTLHDLSLADVDGEWRARVVLDV